MNFLQDLCKVAEGFGEHSGHEKEYEKDEEENKGKANMCLFNLIEQKRKLKKTKG